MKKAIILLFVVYNSLLLSQVKEIQKAADRAHQFFHKQSNKRVLPNKYVNPFVGTGGHGHTFPGACAPFGMIQVSPDTRFDGWDGCSGYHYSDSIIHGFSHTHLSGTGVSDYGDLLIMPEIGKPRSVPKYIDLENGFGSTFSHADETASPGYYTVELKDLDIRVRLTAGKRSAMHEYTFPLKTNKKSFIIDLQHRDRLINCSLKLIGDSLIEGFRISTAWAKEQHFYFSIKSNSSLKRIKNLGNNRFAIFIDEKTQKSYLHVGISSTDILGARKNRWSEDNSNTTDFASKFTWILGQTMMDWDRNLSKIIIESKSPDVLTNFYTALYHTMIAPNLFSDVDGRYRGMDNKLHLLDKMDNQYTVFSLWDTYRATHPLYTIIDTNRTAQFIRTFLRQYDQSNDLPVWELNANETDCMIGYHSASVIADAYSKGIKGFNREKALEAMIKTSKLDEFGKIEFHKNGFISSQNEAESVSKTLEYAYDDFCISEFAKGLGDEKIQREYANSSYNYSNLFDPSTGFMRARKGAQWFSPFVPEEVNFNYTEANSWQYSMYAPQHIDHLITLLGGQDSLENWLDKLFTCSSETSGRVQADITGLIGQYAHGNEPSHHMAYLYNYTQAPFKTQFYIDSILNHLYTPLPDGLSGNEDCGQMSAWYVFSSIGLYPVTPGRPIYQIGRPIIDNAQIRLENGKFFEIEVLNNSSKNKFIQSIRLNDSIVKSPFITHQNILNGSKLIIEMGPSPIQLVSLSNQEKVPQEFISVPYLLNEKNIFEDSIQIKMNSIQDSSNVKIYFKINDGQFEEYSSSFYIYKSSSISIKSIKKIENKIYESATLTSNFVKKSTDKSLILKTSYANQYSASGENTLIDGIYGGHDYRTGDWQGFYGKDVVAEIRFNELKKIKVMGVSCLKDIKSWIFFPKEITILGSLDGVDFEKIKTIRISKMNENDKNNEVKKFIYKNDNLKSYRVFKFLVSNAGKCPNWHLGSGNNSWLFLDEIILE